MGLKEVPVIRLDHLTDEQRRAYTLVHNKLTMNSGFDFEMLSMELDDLSLDMSQFGFEDIHIGSFFEEEDKEQDKKPESDEIRVVCKCKSREEFDLLVDFLFEKDIEYTEL